MDTLRRTTLTDSLDGEDGTHLPVEIVVEGSPSDPLAYGFTFGEGADESWLTERQLRGIKNLINAALRERKVYLT